ncbi:Pantothenate kinase type III, CoaX-like [Pseudoalteromonas luteoviolacea B = ATCC 29581]|nr:Pantothenate kinase type III, CoaX-like [Pseudoalteromonas luteoviolacea B = ATCC 29581]
MNVYVDVGNTAIKLSIDNGADVQVMAFEAIDFSRVSKIVVGKVGKQSLLNGVLEKAKQYNLEIIEANVTPDFDTLRCAYAQYQNLGIDRWLAVIACYRLFSGHNVVIVDSGTATTIDALESTGRHLGGWIVPGLDLMMSSLTAQTQKVFVDDTSPFEHQLGRNTPNAVKNGCLSATLGAVNEAIKIAFANSPCKVVYTGGYGKLLHQHHDNSEYLSRLVFLGLKFWFQNQQK